MKPIAFLAPILLAGILVSCTQQTSTDQSAAAPAAAALPDDGRLWYEKPFRLIQTNLREIDAVTLDPEEYVSRIKDFKATAALFNVGGIVANYPSELKFEYVNPNLREDMVGKVLERLHAEGIAMMGRFDFSKINEAFAFKNPDWLYKNVKGEFVNYNGQVHTCINGYYQQEYSLKILSEVLEHYDLDGVFFNMIGYPTRDYSQNYHGICQCGNCIKRFAEYSCGMKLPVVEDTNDPVFNKYREFKQFTIDDLFTKTNGLIKSFGEDIAVCTYTIKGVDIVRRESGSGMWRRLEWDYHGSDNVKLDINSWTNRTVANTMVHFVDYPARHAGVWPHLAGRRLIQNMIHGAPLDYYMIGRLDNQEDRALMPVVKDIFHFHADNEAYFTDLHSVARVVVIRKNGNEFKGLVRILSENHIPYDIMHPNCLRPVETPKKLEDYDIIVLPDYRSLSDEEVERIDKYVKGGGKVLATGFPSTEDKLGNPLDRIRLKSAGIEEKYILHPREQGRYLRIFPEDKETLKIPPLGDIDIIYLYVDFMECSLKETARGYLGFIPVSMYGPPEKCYYTEVTEIPGIIENIYGDGKFVLIPWQIGDHYEYKSQHAHSMIVQTALNDLLELEYDIKTDASPIVEISLLESDHGDYTMIGINNLSGQVGTAYHKPIPISDISFDLKMDQPVKTVRLLRSKQKARMTNTNGIISFTVPVLNEYEVVIVEH
jgi:hypothetical protein